MAGWVESDNWVRVYETSRRSKSVKPEPADTLVLKPVTVAEYAREAVWKHAEKWLLMSATIISASRMAADLGLEDHEWRFVSSPSSFAPERRPIYVTGLGNMSRKTMDEGLPKVVEGIRTIIERHQGENVLVHAHTYDVTRQIVEGLKGHQDDIFRTEVPVWSYTSARDRELVVRRFREQGGVCVAPSLGRGADFPDELVRVQIIAKVPFPYMGDPQISERMHTEGGQDWYDVQTVRAVVQMCGRGMRPEGDWCATYIVDGGFLKSCWRAGRLFPGWFKDAVRIVSARQMLEGRIPQVVTETVDTLSVGA
jgi:Rad3-related DNA helicase